MPQALPLQPVQESDQERTAPGLEPGTGVRVATMAAVTPGWRLEGAASCNAKWLAMVTAGKFCLGGSATLVAGRGALGAGGGMAGGGWCSRGAGGRPRCWGGGAGGGRPGWGGGVGGGGWGG